MSWLAQLRRAWQRRHLADPAYAFLFDPPPPGEWVALDCETTGLNVRSDEIIAIGAVRIGPGDCESHREVAAAASAAKKQAKKRAKNPASDSMGGGLFIERRSLSGGEAAVPRPRLN